MQRKRFNLAGLRMNQGARSSLDAVFLREAARVTKDFEVALHDGRKEIVLRSLLTLLQGGTIKRCGNREKAV